jgi:hypothetical protein
MRLYFFKNWHTRGLISDDALRQAEMLESRRLFSLFWELRVALYLGVLLLTGGLGILVYKHIDTIGHQAVLAFIALVSAGSFFYCYRKRAPFSWEKVNVADPFFDYILLLGCLTLLIFLGYWQYEYDIFGDHYGTATFVPMVILFFVAYYFDHLGALSLAITNLAAWLGIAITPLKMIKVGAFNEDRLIFTGIFLGVVLLAAGQLSLQRRLKPNFETTYTNFGLHLFFIASLTGLFTYHHIYLLWWPALALVAWFFYTKAFDRRSFYFIVAIVLYTYIGLCYVILRLLSNMSTETDLPIYLALSYFIGSAIGIARLLIYINRQLRSHDRL